MAASYRVRGPAAMFRFDTAKPCAKGTPAALGTPEA